jgi:peptidyl-prolyl cis-trans isomerase C
MKIQNICLLGVGVMLACAASAYAQAPTPAASVTRDAETVIRDDDLTISRAEFQQLVRRWASSMQLAAANEPEARRELAALMLSSKKIALAAGQVSQEQDADFYWELQLQVRTLLRNLMIKHHVDKLKMPDWEPVALERYTADKDKYAKVPETRLSSHIMFRCTPPDCDVAAVNKTANEVMAALRNGADFAEMVQKYSEDAPSKSDGGKFRWVARGESRVPVPYTEAVFALDKPGEYSPVISSQFGLHIIRLDEVKASYYKPYAQVKAQIIATLEAEYKKLAAMEFDRQFGPSGKLVLTDAALDEILAPYKTIAVDKPVAADAAAKAGPETKVPTVETPAVEPAAKASAE